MIRSARIRKLLALALALAVFVGTWAAFAAPLIDEIAADQARIRQSKELIARYDALSAQIPALEERLRTLTASDADGGFLVGNNPAIVAAELQTKVRTLVDAAGVTVRNSQTVPPHDDNGFTRFALQLDLTASPGSLRNLLHALENAAPTMLIEKLSVRVPESADPHQDPDPQTAMAVHIDVAGYRPVTRS